MQAHAQEKRDNVCMPQIGKCIASTASILTLRARCVLHSSNIPFFSVFGLCRGNARNTQPPTNAAKTTPKFNETTTTNTMHECVVTLAYLRGGFFGCSFVCWAFYCFFG